MGLFRKDKVEERLDSLDTFVSEWTPAADEAAKQAAEGAESAREKLAKQLDATLDKRGLAGNIRSQLRKADLKFTVTEYLLFHVVLAVVLGLAGLAIRGVFAGGLGVIAGFFVPRIYVNIKQGQRLKEFQNQLPDILSLWVNSLRAGYSVPQAMEVVARESPPPASDEFKRVVSETQIGVPMDIALNNMLARIESEDLELVFTAVNIQREVGGNLAEILDTITHTIRERIRIKGEIKTLTASGRATGTLIGMLPIGLAILLYFITPDYMLQLFMGPPIGANIPGLPIPCGWPIVAIGLIMMGIGMVAVSVSNANKSDPLAERLSEYAGQAEASASLADIEMSVPFSQRVILPVMQQIAKITTQFAPQQALEKTQQMLTMAGNPKGLAPPVFWAMRLAAMVGLGILMLVILSSKGALLMLLGGGGGAAMGFFMPQLWLSSQINRRQAGIIKALPDALDLMLICVEAGLGFDQAMGKVYERWDNELALGFGRVLKEIQLGKARRDALKAMDESMGVNDVTTFASAIIQADQLGVSISKVLKIQSEQMRIKRRQRAQEKAQQAPIKMMIPMVILIFPSIWLVLLGPAGVQVCKTFMPGLCVY